MLDKQTLINEALAQAKRTSFLDDGFEPVLDRLLTALNTEASLNEVGTGFTAQDCGTYSQPTAYGGLVREAS